MANLTTAVLHVGLSAKGGAGIFMVSISAASLLFCFYALYQNMFCVLNAVVGLT